MSENVYRTPDIVNPSNRGCSWESIFALPHRFRNTVLLKGQESLILCEPPGMNTALDLKDLNFVAFITPLDKSGSWQEPTLYNSGSDHVV